MTLDALIGLLQCPACAGALRFVPVAQRAREAGTCGVLECACAVYPVLDSVPVVRTGRLSRHSIADARVVSPGPLVAEVVAQVRAARGAEALAELLSAPLCPWPLNRVGAARRLSLRAPLADATQAAHRRRTRAMLARREALTAEDWMSALYWNAPEIYDPFNYFFYRFGTPRHLATLGLLTVLPAGGPVLDLACGYGHLGHTLAAQGRTVVGLDQNVHQAWVARHYVAPGAAFVCADADQPFPFRDGAFGSAFCSDAFHYIHDKAAALSELDRTTSGGLVALATVGNAGVGEPDGEELTPDGYAGLLAGWAWRVRTEDDLLGRYLSGLSPDLSAPSPEASVDRARWLSYVAARDPEAAEHALRDHGALGDWPHASGVRSLNPLYERAGDQWRLQFPSTWYEAENSGILAYAPEALGLPVVPTEALVAQAAFVGLPERYARPSGRPWYVGANRTLGLAARRVRSAIKPRATRTT